MIPEKEQTAVFLESGCIKFHKKFREGNGFQGLGKSKSQTQGHDNKAYSAAGNPWDEMGNRLPRKFFPLRSWQATVSVYVSLIQGLSQASQPCISLQNSRTVSELP